jgi:hypothetical protein
MLTWIKEYQYWLRQVFVTLPHVKAPRVLVPVALDNSSEPSPLAHTDNHGFDLLSH